MSIFHNISPFFKFVHLCFEKNVWWWIFVSFCVTLKYNFFNIYFMFFFFVIKAVSYWSDSLILFTRFLLYFFFEVGREEKFLLFVFEMKGGFNFHIHEAIIYFFLSCCISFMLFFVARICFVYEQTTKKKMERKKENCMNIIHREEQINFIMLFQ